MKNVIIIGASSGIGNALAVLYAKKGYAVTAIARRSELLSVLKRSFPNRIQTYAQDIAEIAEMVQLLDRISDKLNQIDIVINCASIVEDNPTLESSIEQRTIEINVTGFAAISAWAYNAFKQQKSGSYAGLTSVFGARGRRLAPSYNASKAFQINYLEGLRQKAENEKIKAHFLDIRPGFVKTKMVAEDTKMLPVIRKERAAKLIYNAIAKQNSVNFIPFYWSFFEKLLKFIPNRIYERM